MYQYRCVLGQYRSIFFLLSDSNAAHAREHIEYLTFAVRQRAPLLRRQSLLYRRACHVHTTVSAQRGNNSSDLESRIETNYR